MSRIIKICGLRTIDRALAAATAGADLIGLVFAPSRRRVTVAEAQAIAAAVRTLPPPRPLIVGLFVNEPAHVIAEIARTVGLEAIQLSGDEPADFSIPIELPLIKAIRMTGDPTEEAWLARIAATKPATGNRLPTMTALVDAHIAGVYGGTGQQADWQRAAHLARRVPTLLAGGLTPANVAQAIAVVNPLGVDVSSGVERDGQKDPELMAAFVRAVRMSDAVAECGAERCCTE
ncbi:phosphoribosylanthranilate isomerase [Chloroflexus aggregans]|uniref:N-(5'-phosphoribosyl)anthranilate isomerase n=1 Tax=Chloroflexus aggregans (strain MD-66 / DSM 9485) TaxID=326427 RepID=B8GAG5_CHLAD|nr:phosphoribosylanthranilate isomerase [Chloroflexus aggregans]ACL26540.1 Phosphoribosylanthranilate isomerase [Chloroflexus aggregans DSM 9485]